MKEIEKLEKKFRANQISRREFLAKASVLGIAAFASPALLSKAAFGSTPRKGGTLRIGVFGGSTTDSLDPGLIVAEFAMLSSFTLRNGLIEIDSDSNLIPELAESWEPFNNAKKWVFNLRKGVEFHNGKSFSAEDVIYTINYHRDEKSKSAMKVLLDGNIDTLDTDGKYKVIFTLKRGNADFPAFLASYAMVMMSKGSTPTDGMGTGAYQLENFEPGVGLTAKKNPNYWKSGRAHFDSVEINAITDTAARTSALRSKQIDVINKVDRKTANLLKDVKGIEVVVTPGPVHYSFPMLTDTAPFNNKDVRLGLKYAIDREAMVKKILRGYGYVGNDHPIANFQKYFAAELPQRKYDPDKAKYHMKKAKMMDHTFQLYSSEAAFSGAIDAAVLYKEHAIKAGIKIEVIRAPADGYWSDVWTKKPWCTCFWNGRITEDWMFSSAYAAEAKWNDTRWKNPKFNQLLVEARGETDEAKRRAMYVEMQEIVRDDGGTPIPMFASHIDAATSKLKHGKVAGAWELDGYRCAERWWFDA